MTTETGLITYREYLEGPECKLRKEIVDGQVIMFAAPVVYHQTILVNILAPAQLFVIEHGLGRFWCAPVDVVVQREPLRVRQPDLLFVSSERLDIVGDRIEGGPDLVVEILSPGNTRPHIESKLADYALIDVRECWLASLQDRTIEVLRQDGGQWRRASIHGVGQRLESAVLPGLELDIAAIFRGHGA